MFLNKMFIRLDTPIVLHRIEDLHDKPPGVGSLSLDLRPGPHTGPAVSASSLTVVRPRDTDPSRDPAANVAHSMQASRHSDSNVRIAEA